MGFIDDCEIFVFVEDRERDILGKRFGGGIGWDLDGDFRSFGDGGFRLGVFAIEADIAGFYEALQAGPGELGEVGSEYAIESLAGIGSGGGEGEVESFVGHGNVLWILRDAGR